MARKFRCVNGKHKATDFTVAAGEPVVCPECKVTQEKFPRIFTELAIIHLDPPGPVAGVGQGIRVCDGKTCNYGGGFASGVPSAVTCQACRATPAFKEFFEAWESGAETTLMQESAVALFSGQQGESDGH